MIQVLFDTNIILDIALNRNPYFNEASQLFGLIDKKKITGYITATTITDIYYLAKKELGHDVALDFISNLIEVVNLIGVDKEIVLNALTSGMKDFEDAIQVFAAKMNNIKTVITRNKSNFTGSSLEIYSPSEFLQNF